ncbi:MAG: colicin import membrane protein [Arenicella sp.]|jgi:colicin import membrane protein
MAYIAAGTVHALIIAGMVLNFTSKPKAIDGAYADKVDVVKAALVEDTQIKKRKEKVENDELEKNLQKQRDLERIAKKKLEAAKKIKDEALAQAKRKAIELKKNKDLAKQKKDKKEKDKKEKDRKEKLERDKAEAERLRREEQELEAQRQLNASIAAEEAFIAQQRAKQRTTTLVAKYTALITEKVQRLQSVAPGTELWRTTMVNVKLSSSGEVQSVRVVKSSGDERYDRSVETAIYQASPLPIPSTAEDPGVNRAFQDLNLNFDMSGQ